MPGHDWLYAIGDVNGRVLLTHMGKYQGRIAADVILGKDAHIDPLSDGALSPRVTFTEPQVAAVGHTLASAQEAGLPVRAVDMETSGTAGGSFYGRNAPGTSRLVVDEKRRVIVGATFCGTDVAEWLQAATFAVVGEVPIDKLWHAVPSFPTRSEVWLRLFETYGLSDPLARAEPRTSPPTARRETRRCSRGRAERARARGASAPVAPEELWELGEAKQPVGVPGSPVGVVAVDDAIDDVVRFGCLVEELGDLVGVHAPLDRPRRSALREESKGGPTPGPPTTRVRAGPAQNDQGKRRGYPLASRVSDQQLEREQRVSPVELFFDLVFVFGLTQVTTVLSDNPTWSGLMHGLLVLGALWWAWAAYAWLTNLADPNDELVRGTMLLSMAAMFVAALAVPVGLRAARSGVRSLLLGRHDHAAGAVRPLCARRSRPVERDFSDRSLVARRCGSDPRGGVCPRCGEAALWLGALPWALSAPCSRESPAGGCTPPTSSSVTG